MKIKNIALILFILSIAILFGSGNFYFSGAIISGQVMENGEPAANATLYLKGFRNQAVMTDKKGLFQLEIPQKLLKKDIIYGIALSAQSKIKQEWAVKNDSVAFVYIELIDFEKQKQSNKKEILNNLEERLNEKRKKNLDEKKIIAQKASKEKPIENLENIEDKKKSRRERKKEENPRLTTKNNQIQENKPELAVNSKNRELNTKNESLKTDTKNEAAKVDQVMPIQALESYRVYEKLSLDFNKNLIIDRKLPLEKQIDLVIKKLKIEKELINHRNNWIRNEIAGISDKFKNSPELSEKETEKLGKKIFEMENQIQENDSAYQKLKEQTTEEIKNLRKQANIQEAFLKRNRNFLRITLFIGLSLVILSIWFYYLSQKRRKQRDFLTKLVKQIELQKEEIKTQNIQIIKKSDEVESAYTKITDSIRYAQRLQSAVLGDEQQITNLFQESFMVFIPKDVVSGDFYWTTKIDHLKIIVAADCTGHGIPGAMLTMLGNSILNDVIIEECVYSPEQILKELDIKFTETIEKQTTGKKPMDGIDLVVLVLDEITQTVRFSGAVNSLYFVRNNELHQVKASPFPIGITPHKKNKTFTLHEFPYQKNDIFYLSSDGFQDQFGGKENKKYLKINFREFLLKTSSLPLAEQKEQFFQEFHSWKGNLNQTDDVLVIGLKV